MNEGGFSEYRCRRCGETTRCVHVPDCLFSIIKMELEGVTPKVWGMQMRITDIHYCKDGNMGVTDLIGAVFDRKKED